MLNEARTKLLEKAADDLTTIVNRIQTNYVKSMPGVIIKEFPEDGMSEEQLIEQGFEPIDKRTKLIWIKHES